ncbi:MAG: response regulator [Desulfovibrionaceae bacterium]|nr:response regulator [Desulfovibrionaceae bacterium]
MRIVLADDEREFVETLAERLTLRGHSTRVVYDGQAVLGMLEQELPDVLVLDWLMPGLSGEEVLQQVTALYPALPVILLTGHGCVEAIDDILAAQRCVFLTIPLRFDNFLEILEDTVQGKRP